MRMRPKYRFLTLAVIFAGGIFGYRWAVQHGYVPKQAVMQSSVPKRAELPDVPAPAPRAAIVPAALPPPTPSHDGGSPEGEVRIEFWKWNAQAALIAANGGATTAPGSPLAKRGVRARLIVNEDTEQMKSDMLAFATDLANGERHPRRGAGFVIIMGDGTAQFFASLNPQLARVCPDCTSETIAGLGYSRGEDAFMVPPAVKADPQKLRGMVVAGVIPDGDWNIVLKLAADLGIPNNPDDTTYDPNAINWVNAETYTKAAELYVAGYCEERSVVGALGKKRVCVAAGSDPLSGVTTWTPGDVTVATGRGGLVRMVSTKEYRWQMGATLIGIKRYVDQNRETLLKLLDGVYEEGERIQGDPGALQHAMALSAQVYGERDAAYWLRYFKGVTERDASPEGLMVQLGGSAVNNLGDAAHFFGLTEGGTDLYRAVYEVFGEIVKQQYPRRVPSYPPYEQIVDRTLVAELLRRSRSIPEPDMPTFQPAQRVVAKLGDRAWDIRFETGRATFATEAQATLRQLFDQLSVSTALVEIHGHTDNTGSSLLNRRLSEDRALAVKHWLQLQSPTNFPESRFTRVVAHGQDSPVAPNDTAPHMALNRRVQVVVGTGS